MKGYKKLDSIEMHQYLERWAEQYYKDKFRIICENKGKPNYEQLLETEFIPLFIGMLEHKLNNDAYREIEIAEQAGSIIGTFILCSCFIGYVAFYFSRHENDNAIYKDYVQTFLKEYDSEALYSDLRCKLVHNFSEGGSYIFISEKPQFHQLFDQKLGKTYINLQNFMKDIKEASIKFFNMLKSNKSMNHQIIERHNYAPLLWSFKKDN